MLKVFKVLNIIKSIIIKFCNLKIIVIFLFNKGLLIKVISKLYNKDSNNIFLSIASFIKAAKNLKVYISFIYILIYKVLFKSRILSLLSYNLFYPYYNAYSFFLSKVKYLILKLIIIYLKHLK